MDYTISVLTDRARIPELIELFRTGLGDTNEQHWIWRLFTDNGQPDQPMAVIAEDAQGRMAAVSSMLPAVYGTGITARKCLQFCDWVVHPDHRGKGLIGRLYRFVWEYYAEKGYDFIMEFPNDNSYPIFMKYGFHEEAHIPCWNTSKRLVALPCRLRDQKLGAVVLRHTAACPLTNEKFEAEGRIQRSAAYLQWKYDRNPDTNYRWISFWREEVCIGYVVYTIAQGRLRRAVNVYDWECPKAAEAAFREAIRQLSRLGNWVSIWGRYPTSVQEMLEHAGLRKEEGGTRLIFKALSEKGWPDPLTLTRIDTDY